MIRCYTVYYYRYPLLFVMALCLLGNCEKKDLPCYEFKCEIDDSEVLDWEDIVAAPMLDIVGERITIRSRIYWDHNNGTINYPSPHTNANRPKLLFENADDFIDNPEFRGEGRGNLFFHAPQIIKYLDEEENLEKYALNCRELSNGEAYYLLEGTILFRSSFDLEERLMNPLFVAQSNDVTYWSQKYLFVADMICLEE